ncbi:hypothetical protein, partial [Streptomyces tateyamensis]|uniref:hypothetical protein n=1 Tax=Streptomyces tateyamensis TaxID=565073 RepID=UPI001C646E0B
VSSVPLKADEADRMLAARQAIRPAQPAAGKREVGRPVSRSSGTDLPSGGRLVGEKTLSPHPVPAVAERVLLSLRQ